MTNNPTSDIIGHFQEQYMHRFGQNLKPKVNGALCGKLIKELLKDYEADTIKMIITLYFQDPANENQVFHLPSILSAWSVNKYLPKTQLDPRLYE